MLKGQYNYDWNPTDLRTIVYANGQFDSASTSGGNAAVLYKRVTTNSKDMTVTITNTKDVEYELPETGGAGTHLYTIGGALLIMAAGILLYNHTKRRKEDNASS